MQQSYRIFRPWLWEILSITLAVGLVVAIIALLAVNNRRRTTTWGFGLNFNAILALLSTLLRALLVVVVSQIIGQRKWVWYKGGRERPLFDLQQFDSGSRGSFSALLLIPKVLRKDKVTLIAALVLLASLLIGPFVQQASRTMDCTIMFASSNTSLPYAHYVPRQGGFIPNVTAPDEGFGSGVPAPDLVMAVLSSVTAPGGKENKISINCLTGNCTFPHGDPSNSQEGYLAKNDLTTHSTVGVCNTCIDVTSLISRETFDGGNITVYALPNGFNISYSEEFPELIMNKPVTNLDWLGDSLSQDLRAKSRWAFVNVTVLATNDNGTATAAVCVLYPCLRTYIASVNNGQLSETEMPSEAMQIEITEAHDGRAKDIAQSTDSRNNSYYDYVAVKSPCRTGRGVYDLSQNMSSGPEATQMVLFDFTDKGGPDPYQHSYRNITAPKECVYRQDAQFVMAISTLLHKEIFEGKCTFDENLDCYKVSVDDIYAQLWSQTWDLSNLGAGTVSRSLYNGGNMGFFSTLDWFESFANAMTNRFRDQYGAGSLDGANRRPGEVAGLAWKSTTCVSMHKPWLLLPVCLTIITTLLSVWTIGAAWRCRHSTPVWKDSILLLVFYSQRVESRGPTALTQQSSEEAVSLDEDENGLLEASEIHAISRKTLVAFQWGDDVVRRHATKDQADQNWATDRVRYC